MTEHTSTDGGRRTQLDDLQPETIDRGSTYRLEFVLEKLAEADELSGDLHWRSELWANVTVEELLGALIEADWVLEAHREETSDGYEAAFRLHDRII